MKKMITLFIMICFVFATAMPSFAGPRGHHPRLHPIPGCYPPVSTNIVHKYKVSYNNDWGVAAVALGVGVVAGALVGSYCGPPPPRRVYASPAPVVVTPAPTVIVQQPAAVVVPYYAAAVGNVAVVASELNVRSGPGTEHPVIGKVYQGSVLYVKASSSGWLYVALPSGGFGWVMAQYTTAVGYGGMG